MREKRHPRIAAFPIGEGGPRSGARVLSLIVDLRCIFSLSFIPLSPSNLRPFGAPPSIGRRERPREPLPLEGAAEHSEAGLASFFAALGCSRIMAHLRRSSSLFFIPLVPYPARFARHLPHAGKALSVVILFPHMRVFVLTMREKRYPRIVAFPIGEGGPRQRWIGCSRKRRT